jgi:hypothetical protein
MEKDGRFIDTLEDYKSSTSSLGAKEKNGKLQYDLLPAEALQEIVRVYTKSAQSGKYQEWNWRKGIKYNDLYAAMMRHIQAWRMGEDLDREDGLHHMAHAAWYCLAFMSYYFRPLFDNEGEAKDLDNRYEGYICRDIDRDVTT